MKTTIHWDIAEPSTKNLLGQYLAGCLTDDKLAKAYKSMTGKDILGDDNASFDFFVNGNIAFNNFYKLSKQS
ncbi:MAG: hypothetical protein U1D31_03420 [Patescibacteria group bacterium]|nr:hypothetical protein [Patescibacteria group bacterium]